MALAASAAMAGYFAPSARADVGVVTVNAVKVTSTDSERMSDGRGLGAEMAVVCGCDHMFFVFGGFASIGERENSDVGPSKLSRDIYDVHLNMGFTPATKRKRLSPFISIGVDFLYTNTHLLDDSSAAGVTMGMNARGGVFGSIGKDWFYHASVEYLGAVVPGTGEGLDGVIVQLGLGKHFLN